MEIHNDTYQLDDIFPLHINTVWMSQYNRANEYYHWHNFYEISLVLSGQAQCVVNGQSYHVQEDDIAIFNCNEIHGWKMESGDIQLLVITFLPSLWSDESIRMLIDALQGKGCGFRNVLTHNENLVHNITVALTDILEEWKQKQPDYQLMIKAEMLKLLVLLVRGFQKPNPSKQQIKHLRDFKKIEKVLYYLDSHYIEPVTLESMANLAFLSKNYFSTMFHRVTNQSFMEYVITKRLALAKRLLEETDQNVADIALDCGFCNISNFYKQYNRFYQEKPRR